MKCVSEKCPFNDVNPSCCTYIGGCDFAKFEKTNADHIRSMTDEELRDLLIGVGVIEAVCPNGCDGCDGDCEGHMLNWLKQPYKEDA